MVVAMEMAMDGVSGIVDEAQLSMSSSASRLNHYLQNALWGLQC